MAKSGQSSSFTTPNIVGHPKPLSHKEAKMALQNEIEGSNEVLATATTAVPIFPDTITIDRTKLTIIKRSFFRMADIISIRMEDILNASTSVGFFWGAVSITSRVFNDDQTEHIGMFWRKDAKRMKRIIQGYVIALQKEIDCSQLSTEELGKMLEKLGADNHPASQ
jgi:hypothetical protein